MTLLDEVRAVLTERLPGLPVACEVVGDAVVIRPSASQPDVPWRTRVVADALTAAGYYATRSRTLVRVTREAPPPLGEPDFVCRRMKP